MSSMHKMGLYLMVLGILSLCQSTPWIDWNEAISGNGGSPVNTFTIPNIPNRWRRNHGPD
jgi:hypothetical protein